MSLSHKKKYNQQSIRKIIEDERLIDNCSIPESEIEKIYNDYEESFRSGELEKTKNEILGIINKELPEYVHSTRGRVKDPEHLVEKIYRKSSTNVDKYSQISSKNYYKIITDLIGIRIIILDKRDWREVHKCLLKTFNNDSEKYARSANDLITNYEKYDIDVDEEPSRDKLLLWSYHAEKPVAYGISDDDNEMYKDEYLDFKSSRSNYRSIHYIVRYGSFYFEIQVRTLFEEGWLEFDHRIKYPYDQSNEKKKEFAEILNSLAQTADRLISFYNEKDFKVLAKKESKEKNGITVSSEKDYLVDSLEDKMKRLF